MRGVLGASKEQGLWGWLEQSRGGQEVPRKEWPRAEKRMPPLMPRPTPVRDKDNVSDLD